MEPQFVRQPRVIFLSTWSASALAIMVGVFSSVALSWLVFRSGWSYLIGLLGTQIEDNPVVFVGVITAMVLLPSVVISVGVFQLLKRGVAHASTHRVFALYIVAVFALIVLSGPSLTRAPNWNLSVAVEDWANNPGTPLLKAALLLPVGAYLFKRLLSSVTAHILVIAALCSAELIQLAWGSGVADIGGVLSAYIGVWIGALSAWTITHFPARLVLTNDRFTLALGTTLRRRASLEQS